MPCRPGQPEHGHPGPARHAARRRSDARPEYPRPPQAARQLPVGLRPVPGRGIGNAPVRAAQEAGDGVRAGSPSRLGPNPGRRPRDVPDLRLAGLAERDRRWIAAHYPGPALLQRIDPTVGRPARNGFACLRANCYLGSREPPALSGGPYTWTMEDAPVERSEESRADSLYGAWSCRRRGMAVRDRLVIR